MQYWVYLLRCSDGSYYAGHTDDLKARLAQHEQGLCCAWTRRRRPVELVWCDCAPTREEVLAFEQRIKCWTRQRKEALIAGDWDRINWLSRSPHERESVRPERSEPEASAVEGRLAQPPQQRPSTALRTNEPEIRTSQAVRPERSAKRVVEGRVRGS